MQPDATRLLSELVSGDPRAADRLVPVLYRELHRLAQSLLARERTDHTLQPTALVNEAYVRLIDHANGGVNDRAHFIALAARTMRNVLVDHARRRNAEKRGGERQRIEIEGAMLAGRGLGSDRLDILALHEALQKLAAVSELTVQVVEMRYFGGLTVEETAAALNTSASSIEREWRFARAWLRDALSAYDTRTTPSVELQN